MQRRIPWTLVLAVAVGLIIAGVSSYYLFRYASSRQITDHVPVPNRDILAYEEVTSKDLEWRVIPAGGFEPGAVKTPEEVVGKIALTTLYKGEQIRLERLTDRAKFDASQQLVTVNVDLTRSGGGNIRPGDLVDVYWLEGEQVPGSLVAQDAVVISVRDAQGRLITGQAGGSGVGIVPGGTEQAPPLPAVVTLAVKPEEVGLTVRGAWGESKNVALVKKFRSVAGAVAILRKDVKDLSASVGDLGERVGELVGGGVPTEGTLVPGSGEGVSGGSVSEAGE